MKVVMPGYQTVEELIVSNKVSEDFHADSDFYQDADNCDSQSGVRIDNMSENVLVSGKRLFTSHVVQRKVGLCHSDSDSKLVINTLMHTVLNVPYTFFHFLIFKLFRYVDHCRRFGLYCKNLFLLKKWLVLIWLIFPMQQAYKY